MTEFTLKKNKRSYELFDTVTFFVLLRVVHLHIENTCGFGFCKSGCGQFFYSCYSDTCTMGPGRGSGPPALPNLNTSPCTAWVAPPAPNQNCIDSIFLYIYLYVQLLDLASPSCHVFTPPFFILYLSLFPLFLYINPCFQAGRSVKSFYTSTLELL